MVYGSGLYFSLEFQGPLAERDAAFGNGFAGCLSKHLNH